MLKSIKRWLFGPSIKEQNEIISFELVNWFSHWDFPESINLPKSMTRDKLQDTLKPDPAYRARRLAQFSPERQQRYIENIRKAGL